MDFVAVLPPCPEADTVTLPNDVRLLMSVPLEDTLDIEPSVTVGYTVVFLPDTQVSCCVALEPDDVFEPPDAGISAMVPATRFTSTTFPVL